MTSAPDFRLVGFSPADRASEQANQSLYPEDCTMLAQHHSADGTHTFLVLHDSSAIWGAPDQPQLVAVKVTRDPTRGTFRFETTEHAALAFAQHWLIEHGCPPSEILPPAGQFLRAADETTLRIEEQIRSSRDRYRVVNGAATDYDDLCETWTMVRDTHRNADALPIRIFLEQADLYTGTYTMREGAFASMAAARKWLKDRDRPLPEPPRRRSTAGLRAQAAIARSAAGTAANTVAAPTTPQATAPAKTGQRSR